MSERVLTVQEQIFTEAYYQNGGDIVAAVEHAAYRGLGDVGAVVCHGHKLLQRHRVRVYLARLTRGKDAPALVKLSEVAPSPEPGLVGVEKSVDKGAESPTISIDCADGVSVMSGTSAAVSVGAVGSGSVSGGFVGLDPPAAAPPRTLTTVLPSNVFTTADGRRVEMAEVATPEEIRGFLTSVMRNRIPSMRDGKYRLRAVELLMKNLGMLAELSLTANVSRAEPEMTAAEREAEMARLEQFIAQARGSDIPRERTLLPQKRALGEDDEGSDA